MWPSPPTIARVRYLAYFAGMKIDYTQTITKKKQSWMDRLAGAQSSDEKVNPKNFPFQLLGPYGIAIDSKGLVYVADQKVGAVFIFNTETRDVQLIRNGAEAHFGWINGLAIDDDDRLFVSDGKMHRVLVFNPKHEVIGQISERLVDPVGLALDTENRFLYVVDTQQDQVVVFDADSLKAAAPDRHWRQGSLADHAGRLRRAAGYRFGQRRKCLRHRHTEQSRGDFRRGGHFRQAVRQTRRRSRVLRASQGHRGRRRRSHLGGGRLQRHGCRFSMTKGNCSPTSAGHGHYPGQFEALVGVAIDKQNRVFTTEQYPGRMQMFRYVTDAEAAAEKTRQEEERKRAADAKRQSSATAPPASPAEAPQ